MEEYDLSEEVESTAANAENAANPQQHSTDNGEKARAGEDGNAGDEIGVGDDEYVKVRLALIYVPILLVSPDLLNCRTSCDDTEVRNFNPPNL